MTSGPTGRRAAAAKAAEPPPGAGPRRPPRGDFRGRTRAGRRYRRRPDRGGGGRISRRLPRSELPRSRASLTSPDAVGDVRLRLDIAYDGTDFAGWAVQDGQRTVAVLDEAFSTIFRVPLRLFAAGRTDTGVHATGQVAHIDIPAEVLPKAHLRSARPRGTGFLPLVRRLGRLLPEDVRVRGIVRAPVGFDARFRRCAGTTATGCRWPLRSRAGAVPVRHALAPPLDIDAMAGPHESCWASTTSPRSAVTGPEPPRSATCNGWIGCARGSW